MLGWSTEAEANGAGDQGVVAAFRKRRARIENAGVAAQVAFQVMLAAYWEGFIAEHGSAERFARLPRAAQMQYFRKLLRLQASLFEQNDFDQAIALEMLNIYLAAIIGKCRDFKIEAAAFLERHATQGGQMAGLHLAPGHDGLGAASARRH